MKKSINGTVKFWRIALREIYQMGIIEEDTFITMYTQDFINRSTLNKYENTIQEIVMDTIKNKELFTVLIKEELAFVSKGELPEAKLRFKPMWLSYLLDSHESNLLELDDYNELKDAIDFDIPDWLESEIEIINMILDMVRLTILQTNPYAMDFFDNPSFDLLMHANGMDKW